MLGSAATSVDTYVRDSGLGEERRRNRRLNILGRVARLDALGGGGLCRVLDLSDGGSMVETPLELTVGSPVRIAFDCSNSIQGRVAWQDEKRAGIRFITPVDSTALIRKLVSDRWEGKARQPRMSVNRAATVTSDSGSFLTVVGNISQHGMSLCHSGDLAAGTAVEVSIEGSLKLRGTVRWSAGLSAGIELVSSIPVEQLASARSF